MNNRSVDRRTLLAAALTGGAGLLWASGGWSRAAASGRYPVMMSPTAWRAKLGAARFSILREEGTERPYSSPLLKEHRKGIFACAGCGQAAYSSTTKFESGTGWPSFYAALSNAVGHRVDTSLGERRIEEHCSRCGGHLGHVFDDGPPPTGKRHCINGLALRFAAR